MTDRMSPEPEPLFEPEQPGTAETPGTPEPLFEVRDAEEPGAPPPAPSGPLDGVPTRLHPSVVAIWSLQAAGPAAVGLFLVGSAPLMIFGLVPVVLAWAGGQYWRFRWHLEPGSVVIQRGLLFTSRRVIPRERIQSVDLERSLLRRILGVVQVRVEAIGGEGTEGQLDAIRPEVAESLRRILLRRGAAEEPAAGTEGEEGEREEDVVATVDVRGLLAAGITGGRIGIGAALFGFVFQFVPSEWIEVFVSDRMEAVEDPAAVEAWFSGAQFLVILVVLAILAGFLISLVYTVVQHWGFTLSRSSTGLAVRRGLLTQHRDTVPFNRIQAVRIEENWLRRRLGLAALRVVVAGRAGAEKRGGTDLLLPIGPRDRVWAIARDVVGLGTDPNADSSPVPTLNRMPKGARDRRLVRGAIQTALFVAVASVAAWIGLDLEWYIGPGVAALVVAPVAVLIALMAWRGLGWADLSTHVVVREGAFTRKTSLVPVSALQELLVTETFFQRRRRLSTMELRVAASTAQGIDMARSDALDLQQRLADRVVSRGWEASPGSVQVKTRGIESGDHTADPSAVFAP